MTDQPIYSHTDLKNEIYRLQGLEREKGLELKQRFSSPGAIFSSIFSLFSGNDHADAKDGGIFKQDFLGVLSRFALPFTLNRTLFKNSNFIVKALVGLVSQKASHFISEDSVEGVWDKAKGLFGKVTHLFDKSDKKTKPEVTSFRKIKKD
ncbi:hypothetical protein FO440_03670 [Mucilaginibacter corticis]|uniref:Uncharacterized protein n=1 Tax=Mucilaginibacter corticis TaxID=2597670 RepID=A0A556MTN7_9SPHI|nr:hypothetical protein [Mucilaginibacter corticis]TSJ43304.1 hypothetical protein FO440_03670 [Mucilaginibacter corticis]